MLTHHFPRSVLSYLLARLFAGLFACSSEYRCLGTDRQ
jgi:hypothetical protein